MNKKKQIEVSVIISNYNYGRYIEESINSIKTSNFDANKIEIIIVDDASTDNSINILKEIVKKTDIKIKVTKNKENIGQLKSLNIGVHQAKGKFLFFLDSDNFVGKDCIKKHYDFLCENQEYSGCYAPIQKFNDTSRENTSVFSNEPFDFEKLKTGNYIDHMSMIKKNDLLEIGLYDNVSKEVGYDLWLKFGKKNKKIAFIEGEPLSFYRVFHNRMLSERNESNKGQNLEIFTPLNEALVQVYWGTSALKYSKKKLFKKSINLTDTPSLISFSFPPGISNRETFRFDIGNKIGVLNIHSIEIKGQSHQLIWAWDRHSTISKSDILLIENNEFLPDKVIHASITNNPQFLISPPDTLKTDALNGFTLEIVLSRFDQQQMYMLLEKMPKLKVIVTGMEHSGTTFLNQLITTNSSLINSGFECGILLSESPNKFGVIEPFYEWLCNEHLGWALTAEQRDAVCNTDSFNEFYNRLFKTCSLFKNGELYVLDKTPAYSYILPDIIKKMPDVPVLVVIKDIEQLWHSYMKRNFSFEHFVERYFRFKESLLNVLPNKNIKVINLEKIADYKPDEVKDIFSFINLPFNEIKKIEDSNWGPTYADFNFEKSREEALNSIDQTHRLFLKEISFKEPEHLNMSEAILQKERSLLSIQAKKFEEMLKKEKLDRHKVLMASKVWVSVIIPNYNYSKYIKECINSVLTSNFPNDKLEIIFVDDASTDDSVKIVNKIKIKSKIKIHLIKNQINVGLAKTRNVGIKKSKGQFLFFLDSDNYLTKDCLKKHFDFLSVNEEVSACYAPIQKFDDTTGELLSIFSNEPYDYGKLSSGNYIDAMSMIRKKDLLEIGLYDEKMPINGWEDYELWLRIGKNNKKVHFIDGPPLSYYRTHSASMINNISDLNYQLLITYLNSKHVINRKQLESTFCKEEVNNHDEPKSQIFKTLKEAFVQVYWETDISAFSEENSFKKHLALTEAPSIVSFPFPTGNDNINTFCFGLGTGIGLLNIHSIEIKNNANDVIWSWDKYTIKAKRGVLLIDNKRLPGNVIQQISFSDYPQLLCSTDEHFKAGATDGYTIEISLSQVKNEEFDLLLNNNNELLSFISEVQFNTLRDENASIQNIINNLNQEKLALAENRQLSDNHIHQLTLEKLQLSSDNIAKETSILLAEKEAQRLSDQINQLTIDKQIFSSEINLKNELINKFFSEKEASLKYISEKDVKLAEMSERIKVLETDLADRVKSSSLAESESLKLSDQIKQLIIDKQIFSSEINLKNELINKFFSEKEASLKYISEKDNKLFELSERINILETDLTEKKKTILLAETEIKKSSDHIGQLTQTVKDEKASNLEYKESSEAIIFQLSNDKLTLLSDITLKDETINNLLIEKDESEQELFEKSNELNELEERITVYEQELSGKELTLTSIKETKQELRNLLSETNQSLNEKINKIIDLEQTLQIQADTVKTTNAMRENDRQRYLSEIEKLREQAEWLKNTYEKRSILGIAKDRFIKYLNANKEKKNFSAVIAKSKVNYKTKDFIIDIANYFDADYYHTTYGDIKAIIGNGLEHYLNVGWKEGRSPSSLFNVNYYLESNPDVKEAGIEPLYHYINFGWKEGRNPNYLFDVGNYFIFNPDIKSMGIEPLYHYFTYGWKEGRNPSGGFNTESYLKSNPDLANSGICPLKHYLEFRLKEEQHAILTNEIIEIHQERQEKEIGSIAAYSDLTWKTIEDSKYSGNELVIAKSRFFDAEWYSHNYGLDTTEDPVKHYLEKGWKELYNPSNIFSTVQYLVLNKDIEAEGINPLLHYELYGKNQDNRIYHEPHVIDFDLNNEYKRQQDDYLNATYSKDTKKLIVYLVPEVDVVSGGVMSICSMARVTRDIKELSDHTVLVSTAPSVTSFFQYSKFESGFNLQRFEQLRVYFNELEEIIIHIPETYVYYFLLKIIPSDADWLRKLKKTQINILNQNMALMPRYKYTKYLKQFGHTTTMTCAHKRYCTKQLRSSYDMPVHFFSTSNLIKYKYVPYEEKENIIAYSPDGNPFKDDVLTLLKQAFPDYQLLEIKNMSYDQYLSTVGRAKWMITFGEGIDGYFVESIRSGAIAFSVRNHLFFDENQFNDCSNIYDSYFDMLGKIVNDIKKLDNKKSFTNFNNKLRVLDAKIYNDEEYKDNIKQYYLNNYTYPIDGIQKARKERIKRKPLISIVMATYNGEAYLEKQLNSLVFQTYSNFEIIVSDDNSTDSTLAILRKFSKKYGLTVLSNKNSSGLVGNFSNGLMAAKGEYIALCDQDDIWELNKLDLLLERIDDFDIVQGQLVIIDEKGNYHPAQYMHDAYETDKTSLYSIENYIKENPMLGCATLITKQCIKNSLPVPEGFVYHDWWIALNAILKGNGICNVDIPVVKYRQHTSNTAKSNFWSPKWCKKKYDSDNIILKELDSSLNSTAKHLLKCDMNLMLLYNFARKYAPKLSFEYFDSNSVAFTDNVMEKLAESINLKEESQETYEQ